MLKQIIFKVLVLFLICNTQFLRSQNLVATYTETRKFEGKMPDEPDPKIRELVKNAGTHTKELLSSAGTSIYQEKQVEMEEGPEHRIVIRIGDDDRGSVYKNLIEKKLIKQHEFFGRNFLIKEALKPINWKLENEQKQIGGYICRKASASIDTMKIIAWYCPDIAINDGPDIFWGLPGLILEVNVDNSKKTIVVNTVKITNEAVAVTIPDKGKEVSQQEFSAIKKEKMDEMRKTHSNGSPDRVEIRVVH